MGETERESAAVTTETAPSLDEVFTLLANQRRRYVLYYLFTRSEGVATIDELANAISTLERRSAEAQTQVRTSLHHAHLPKLEEAGVIEYDLRSETIRYWGQPAVEEWLEHAYYTEVPSGTRSTLERN